MRAKSELIEPCLKCRHALLFGCKAYPDGIPDRFASGMKVHADREPDQTGSYVFSEGENDIEKMMKYGKY